MTSKLGLATLPLLCALSAGASATVISENFNTGTWNAANFTLGAGPGSGSAATGAYVSSGRGTLRTTAGNWVGSASQVLQVGADLTFNSAGQIAFMGVRSTGEQTAPHWEPGDSIFMRIHNFQNGHTGLSGSSGFSPYTDIRPGDAFYAIGDVIRVLMEDDGQTVTGTVTNTRTGLSHSLSLATSLSYGGQVVFSGDSGAQWDNIDIGYQLAAPASAPASLGLVLIGVLMAMARQRRSAARA